MSEYSFADRLKHAWNAFTSRDPTESATKVYEYGSYYRPDRVRFSRGNERSIVTSLYNKIAVDVSQISIRHVRLDENERYLEDVQSGLNNCLSLEANADQTSRAFIQDLVMSMFDEGCVAVVPVETSSSPISSNVYDILQLRVGKIVQWYPDRVKVNIYNDKTGKKQDIILPKKMVAIIENPFYATMNEPNSTLQRLIRKLNLLDLVDEQSGSGKLDMIIQLPYVIKSDARREQAEKRRKDIEMQLTGSKYGIAYTDGTERITQLNRPVENNLLKQIEYLTDTLYGQLGLSKEVFNGTADEKAMLNYQNRTLEPILEEIILNFKRKFLTKTARTRGQSIDYFTEPFKLVTYDELSNIADKFIRNEILTANEIRQLLGIRPSDDPKADELYNPNMPYDQGAQMMDPGMAPSGEENTELETEEDPMGLPISSIMQ